MSLEYTHDYTNHNLLDDKNHRYTKLYKLVSAEASDVKKGDLVLLKTAGGRFGVFIAFEDTTEDNALHLSKYSEFDFTKYDESDSCICNINGIN